MRQVMADSLLQALSYALCRDGVDVAGAQNVVDDARVRGLDVGGERVCCAMVSTWLHARGQTASGMLTRHGRDGGSERAWVECSVWRSARGEAIVGVSSC